MVPYEHLWIHLVVLMTVWSSTGWCTIIFYPASRKGHFGNLFQLIFLFKHREKCSMFLFWLKFSLASLYQQNRNKPWVWPLSSDNMAPSLRAPVSPWSLAHHLRLLGSSFTPLIPLWFLMPGSLLGLILLPSESAPPWPREQLLLPFKILPSSHLLCETFP